MNFRRVVVGAGLLLMVIFPSFPAQAKDAKTILMGKGDWCPYVCDEYLTDGLPGYTEEIIREVFTAAGYTVKTSQLNYSRGIRMVRDGTYALMACMYREDAPDLVFPSVPLGKSVNNFYVNSDNSWRFNGLESLGGVKVGLVQDYKYPEFQSYIDSKPTDFQHFTGKSPMVRMLKMVAANRLDALFDDGNVVMHSASRLGILDRITNAGGFGISNNVLVGFSPRDSRTPELVRILEKGIGELRRSGRLEAILNKYGLQDWVRSK